MEMKKGVNKNPENISFVYNIYKFAFVSKN